MPALRLATWLCLCLLLAAPAPSHARGGPQPAPAIELAANELLIDATCPGASQAAPPYATIDGGTPLPAQIVAAPVEPAQVAIVIATGPAMAEPGTPHSTRLADARLLATALLDRLPPASTVSLITFGALAQVALPPTVDQVAARQLLAAATGPQAATAPPATPDALAEALRLADAQLRTDTPARRVIVVLSPDLPSVPLPPAELRSSLDPEVRLSFVGLGTGPDDGTGTVELAAAMGASHLHYHTLVSAELPGLAAAYTDQIGALLGHDRVRLRIPAPGLAAGSHRVSVTGCGALIAAGFDVRPAPLPVGLLGVPATTLVAGGVGYALLRRRLRAATGSAGEQRASPRRAALEQTTARRGVGKPAAGYFNLVVWDGRERRVYPLTARHCTVGRDPGCDLRIESEWVSGLHARLSVVGERVEITDLGSVNGTFIGTHGRCLAAGVAEPLAPGEVVLIGPEVRLAAQIAGDPADEAAL